MISDSPYIKASGAPPAIKLYAVPASSVLGAKQGGRCRMKVFCAFCGDLFV